MKWFLGFKVKYIYYRVMNWAGLKNRFLVFIREEVRIRVNIVKKEIKDLNIYS